MTWITDLKRAAERTKKHQLWFKAGEPVYKEIDPDLVLALIEAVEKLRAELKWTAQTVHRAHHEEPMKSCSKNTCSAVHDTLAAVEKLLGLK